MQALRWTELGFEVGGDRKIRYLFGGDLDSDRMLRGPRLLLKEQSEHERLTVFRLPQLRGINIDNFAVVKVGRFYGGCETLPPVKQQLTRPPHKEVRIRLGLVAEVVGVHRRRSVQYQRASSSGKESVPICNAGLELTRQCGDLDRGRVLDVRLALHRDSQHKKIQLVALQGVFGDVQLLFGGSEGRDGKILVTHLSVCPFTV